MKKLFVLAAIITALYGLTACGDEENSDGTPSVTEEIRGVAWKLYGYGTVKDAYFHKVEPKLIRGALEDQMWEDRFVIIFNTDGTITGVTAANELHGEYIIMGNKITIIRLGSDKGGEPDGYEEDAEYYFNALRSIDSEPYEVKNGQLILYYNSQQDYLQFYRKES